MRCWFACLTEADLIHFIQWPVKPLHVTQLDGLLRFQCNDSKKFETTTSCIDICICKWYGVRIGEFFLFWFFMIYIYLSFGEMRRIRCVVVVEMESLRPLLPVPFSTLAFSLILATSLIIPWCSWFCLLYDYSVVMLILVQKAFTCCNTTNNCNISIDVEISCHCMDLNTFVCL